MSKQVGKSNTAMRFRLRATFKNINVSDNLH